MTPAMSLAYYSLLCVHFFSPSLKNPLQGKKKKKGR